MPDWRQDFFPKEYLTPDDLTIGFKRITPKVIVATVTQKEIFQSLRFGGGKKLKPIMYFKGKDGRPRKKYLILEKITCEAMEHITGERDYSKWPGTEVELYIGGSSKGNDVVRIRAVGQSAQPVQEREDDTEELDRPEFAEEGEPKSDGH